MRESTVIQGWIDIGIEKGIEKGIKKGIKKGKKEGIEKGKKEGMKEGIVKGIEKGKKEGKVEGVRETLRALVKKRFGSVPPIVLQRIEATTDRGTLDRAVGEIFDVARPEDLLA